MDTQELVLDESECENNRSTDFLIGDNVFNGIEMNFNYFVHSPVKTSFITNKLNYDKHGLLPQENYFYDNDILSKPYDELSDSEKKKIIEKLPIIISRLNEIEHRYKNLYSEYAAIALVHGEAEALESGVIKFLSLYPNHKLTEKYFADDYHFRLAESQFYRLIYGSENKIPNLPKTVSYKVSYVEYVVNSKLLDKFNNFKTHLLEKRGKDYCKTVLGFHGTDEDNIESICKNGFLDPAHPEFRHATDSGYYGRGIYFSQYPCYAMQYIRGRKILLLCQILLGRVFCCDVVSHGQNCETGYDSHRSPNANELVVFNSDQILPRYIVHFETVNNELDIAESQTHLLKYDSKFELLRSQSVEENSIRRIEKRKAEDVDILDVLASAKRIKHSRSMEGIRVYVESPNWSNDVVDQIEAVLVSHGAIPDALNFSIFVTDNQNYQEKGQSFRIALERNIPCILITSLMELLLQETSIKERINDYVIPNIDN